MKRGKALVLKTCEDGILVLTADGEFRSLKLRSPLPQPGEEIAMAPSPTVRWLPLVLAAALLLAAVLPLSALAMRPAAYIALDINPSVGLNVGRSGLVHSGEGLNADGARLLSEVEVKGLKPAAAIEGLVRQAAQDGYLVGRSEDVVLLTRVNLNNGPAVELAELEAAARRALEESGREAFVSVEEASPSELVEARSAGVSLNKLRLAKKLEPELPPGKAKAEIVEKLKDQPVREILSEAGKKAADVYRNGHWQGKKKESVKDDTPAEVPNDRRQGSPPGHSVAPAAAEGKPAVGDKGPKPDDQGALKQDKAEVNKPQDPPGKAQEADPKPGNKGPGSKDNEKPAKPPAGKPGQGSAGRSEARSEPATSSQEPSGHPRHILD